MTRDNFLFTVIGLLLGFIIGFMLANSISQREAVSRGAAVAGQQSLPANHPQVGNDSGADPQQTFAQVQKQIKAARDDPKDFDAQVMAAKLEYQVQRYDEAVKFLLIANQIHPDNFEVMAMLGEANMDAAHFDAAEKWYRTALAKKPDDIAALDGLCAVELSKGDPKAAEDAINKLEKIDPTNQDLPQFRDKLASVKSAKK
jgi:tetratricopeptide (TPR) repeat protein